MKDNRLISFLIVIAIYAITIVLGIVIYNSLHFHYLLNLLIADIICTTVVFVFSLLLKNASCYDPYWSVVPVVIAICLLASFALNGPRILVAIAISVWGVRLTANWAYTFKGLNFEDWRYIMLREKTKKFYPFINFLGIHLFPTLVVYLCMIPAVSMFYMETKLNVLVIVFFVFTLLCPLLQLVADSEMHKFRKQKTNSFIRVGLWKYSRHPNYLGEIMMWINIALLAIASCGFHWHFIIGAIVNTLMFLFVSIPMADAHQRDRKPGFEEYKKETRSILPIKKFK